jgi:hypothetical protein
MNIFDGLAKVINSIKPDPENVAQRQETKRARIQSRQEIKQAKIDSGESADWSEFWQSAIESGHSTLDPLSAGGAFDTREGGFGREVYGKTHDSAHAAGSGILGAFGIDAEYDTPPGAVTTPYSPAPVASTGMDTSTMLIGAAALVGLVLLTNRK